MPMVGVFKDAIGTLCARLATREWRLIKGDKGCQNHQVFEKPGKSKTLTPPWSANAQAGEPIGLTLRDSRFLCEEFNGDVTGVLVPMVGVPWSPSHTVAIQLGRFFIDALS